MRDFTPSSGSPQEDIDSNNYTLRQRSRMLYMGAPVAAGAINTNRTNIVGTGLTLQATPDNRVLKLSPEALKEWQATVEAEFSLWADSRSCDALGINNFYELQEMILRSWLMNGDVFVLIKRGKPTPFNPYGLRLHVVEADRVCNPGTSYGFMSDTRMEIPAGQPGAGHMVYDGVEVDQTGAVVAYYVCNCYPFEIWPNKEITWTRVEARGSRTGLPNILHIMQSERPDSYRGVPYLAKSIEPMLQLRRYTESELMGALVQTFHTAWIYTETNQAENPFNETGAGDIEGVEDSISEDDNEYEMGPGTVFHLNPNEKVSFGNPTLPTAGFENFMKQVVKIAGADWELPYEMLMKEFTASYSASRGALLEAWKAFRMRRKWFADDFCNPVYELFLSEAVATGRIRAPGFFQDPLIRKAWCSCQWIGPSQESLDPLKEVQANVLQVENGFKTRTQVTRETSGGDWEANVRQLTMEKQLLDEAGLTPQPIQPAPSESGDTQEGSDDDADLEDDTEQGVQPGDERRNRRADALWRHRGNRPG